MRGKLAGRQRLLLSKRQRKRRSVSGLMVHCGSCLAIFSVLFVVRARQEAEKAKLEEERRKRQEVLDAQMKKQREREEEIEAKQKRKEEAAMKAMEERRDRQRREEPEQRAEPGSWRREEIEKPQPNWWVWYNTRTINVNLFFCSS